ncbi:MAG: 6-phosphogluconolactonase [Candidatus Limnocylindria bacterium]
MSREFTVLPDVPAVAAATADRLTAVGADAIRDRGRFVLALSGGSTPLAVCPLLVVPPRVRMLDWSKVEFFFGDERSVPSRHPESNYNTAREALLDHLPGIRTGQVHRMIGEADDLDAAARAYEAQIARTLDVQPPAMPRFDLIWLGMGPDGHTASLFPGTAALQERSRWAVANWVPRLDTWRMTLTFPVLNAAREALFVVTGAEKAEALAAIRAGSAELPAGQVDAERTTWLVDAAAAGSGSPSGPGG